jgi:hypothetical protein
MKINNITSGQILISNTANLTQSWILIEIRHLLSLGIKSKAFFYNFSIKNSTVFRLESMFFGLIMAEINNTLTIFNLNLKIRRMMTESQMGTMAIIILWKSN